MCRDDYTMGWQTMKDRRIGQVIKINGKYSRWLSDGSVYQADESRTPQFATQIEKLEQAIESWKKDELLSTEIITDLQIRLAELTAEINNQAANIMGLEADIGNVMAERNDFSNEVKLLTAKLAELTVENERLRGEIPKYAKHFDVEKYYTDKDGE